MTRILLASIRSRWKVLDYEILGKNIISGIEEESEFCALRVLSGENAPKLCKSYFFETT